jgi:hypothetical protein
MSASASNNESLLFGEFLAHLRQYGFTIGIDHYLRLHELLAQVGGECSPQDLKTLLCPIFATDAAQQESFYRAFDSYFDLFKPNPLDAPQSQSTDAGEVIAPAQKPESRRWRTWLYLGIASALLIAGVAVWLRMASSGTQQQTSGQGSLEDVTLPTTGTTPATAATPEEFSLRAPNALVQLNFFQRHRTAIIWSSVLAPLLLLLLYEWRRFKRRKLALQKQHGRKPPYVWPIQVQILPPKLYDSDRFYRAARSLRRRHVDEFYRLDMSATISATIEALGYPSFRYKLDSKPPEYLALIERASLRDHQARLFKELTRALEREDIFVERYFYDDGDPRVCCNDAGGACLHLVDLQHRFPGHRLLIFGNGDLLIDPVTGRLKSWTKVFAEWPQKALLTPESPAAWGYRELSLAGLFIVLPATPDGLSKVVDRFDSRAKSDLRSWVRGNVEQPPRLDGPPPQVVAALRRYLGEQTFQWLCACAVYPELQWDLTIFLGSLPCMGESLLREDNLLRLARLPWFRTGTMPDELRWALIGELEQEKERAVRQALIKLLEDNPPPEESFAHDAYQLNLVVQRWRWLGDRRSRRKMLEAVGALPQRQVQQDYTLLRFLESTSASPLSLLLPSRLRKIFYHHGHAAFGMKTGARLLLTLALIALLQAGIYKFIPSTTTAKAVSDAQMRIIRIDAVGARAEVYRNNEKIGETPFDLKTRLGEHVSLTLKSEGYLDEKLDFTVTTQTSALAPTMKKKDEADDDKLDRPTPLPTILPPGGILAYCNANNVNLRSAPSLDGAVIGRLSLGQSLRVLEFSSNYDDWKGVTSNWAYVQLEDSSQRGWVLSFFISQ